MSNFGFKNNNINVANVVETQLKGSIPSYPWLDGTAEPTPADPTKFAWGIKFNASTGVVTVYGWTGSAWVGVV